MVEKPYVASYATEKQSCDNEGNCCHAHCISLGSAEEDELMTKISTSYLRLAQWFEYLINVLVAKRCNSLLMRVDAGRVES